MELTEAVRRRRMTRNFSGRSARRRRRRPADGGRPPGAVGREHPGAGVRRPRGDRPDLAVLGRHHRPRPGGRVRAVCRACPGHRWWCSPSPTPTPTLARYREPDKARADGRSEVEWVVPYWFVDAAFSVMTLLLGATERGPRRRLPRQFPGRGRAARRARRTRPATDGSGPSCWGRPPSPIRRRPRPAGPAAPSKRASTGAAGRGERREQVRGQGIVPWLDPVADPHGVHPCSRYVELYWPGVIGPTISDISAVNGSRTPSVHAPR